MYTALKLCIDIDPALFDECANEYKNQRQLERKHQKEREDNWRHLQQKVERMNSASQHNASEAPYRMGAEDEEEEEYNTHSDYHRADSPSGMHTTDIYTPWKPWYWLQGYLDECFAELEELDISDGPDGTVPEHQHTGEHKDDIHPDMQQFDVPPTQYQSFRRKSIIPVDETVSAPLERMLNTRSNPFAQVFNELSRHVSLDEVLNQAPGAASQSMSS